MKLLLLLTIAAVCYSLPLMSPYKSLDVSMAAKDPIIAQLLDFGTQNLIQQALADKELPHDKFRLAKVNSIHMQSLNGFNYKFNIDLQDDNGVAVNSAFTMHYQPKTNEKSVSSLTYTLKESHPALRPERFYELDTSSYRQNPVVLNLLEFGVQNLLLKSFEAKTAHSQLRFEKLQKAQKQELGLDEGSYYHFKADFKDGAGNKVLGSMTMFYNPNTGQKEMIDSSYDVQKLVSQLQLKNKMTQSADDYFDVDVGAIAEKPEIENALNFGVTQLIEKAIADKQIPVSEYVVENVLEVKRQVTGAGTNYWFDVTLTNHKDTVVDADFIVFTRDSDQEMKLLEFESHVETTVGATEKPVEPDAQKYQLLTKEEAAHDEDLQACLKYGIASALLRVKDDVDIDSTEIANADVQTVEKQATGNVEFYRFNVDLGSDSLTVTTTFTVVNDLATGEKGLKNLLYKIIPVKGDGVIPTDSEGYTFIDLIDVQRIPEIKQNLEFGVIQIITQALAAKNAPVDVYVLSEIQSAKKLMVGETTYYKFVVQLSNNRGTIIQARFTVKYNIQTIRRSLEDSYYEVMEPCA